MADDEWMKVDIGWGVDADASEDDEEGGDDRYSFQRLQMYKRATTTQQMRILGEESLNKVADWHWEPGTAYHFISGGDVDALSYLRLVLHQQKAEYFLLSSWCIGDNDGQEMEEWQRKGLFRHSDFYTGEILKARYTACLDSLQRIVAKNGGRIARFRNHSKVMVVYGERFDCVIESSANCNCNPRTEQTVITVDTGLCDFYKNFYDGIKDFDNRYKDWEKWERERK